VDAGTSVGGTVVVVVAVVVVVVAVVVVVVAVVVVVVAAATATGGWVPSLLTRTATAARAIADTASGATTGSRHKRVRRAGLATPRCNHNRRADVAVATAISLPAETARDRVG
jgi:hypothetical protein